MRRAASRARSRCSRRCSPSASRPSSGAASPPRCPPARPETATGLGQLGLVRLIEPPHTQTNYLLSEMGFRVGRKHAGKLRLLACGLGLGGGALLTLLALAR